MLRGEEYVAMRRPLMRSALALSMSWLLAACVNTSDGRMLEAAESLVPPDSQVTETLENTGPSILVGTYNVHLTVSDGGLGADLLDAIEKQAEVAGWQRISEEEIPAGVRVSYLRNDFRADVSVRTRNDTVDAVIRVEKSDS
jgi:hypothetical protein